MARTQNPFAGGKNNIKQLLSVKYEMEIEVHQMRLSVAKETGNRKNEAKTYYSLGIFYHSHGQYDKAMEHLQKALSIAREINDKVAEGICYGSLGVCYQCLEDYEKAIDYLEKWLKSAKQAPSYLNMGTCYFNLGFCYHKSYKYDKAIEFYNESLKIKTLTGDRAGEMIVNYNLGNCYACLGQFKNSIEQYGYCLALSRTTGKKLLEVKCYSDMGKCYENICQYNDAFNNLRKSLRVAIQCGYRKQEGIAYGRLGSLYWVLGRVTKAISLHQRQLEIAKDMKDKVWEGYSYADLTYCYRSQGQYNVAMDYSKKLLLIAKQTGNMVLEGYAYGQLGTNNYYLGKFHKGMEYLNKSLDISKQIGIKSSVAPNYLQLGLCYSGMELYQKAIEYHLKGLSIAKEIGNKHVEARFCGYLGNCYLRLGQLYKAIDYQQMSQELSEQVGYKFVIGETYSNLGHYYRSLGQYTEALVYFEKSLEIAKHTENNRAVGAQYSCIGICYQQLGKFDEARINHRRAIECFEEEFKGLPKKDEYSISFRKELPHVYVNLSITLIRLGKFEEGLVNEERGRSRSLAELMFNRYSIIKSVESKGTELSTISQIHDVVATMGCTVIFFTLVDYKMFFWVLKPNGNVDFRETRHELIISDIPRMISKARTRNDMTSKVQCEDRSLSSLDTDLVALKEETNICPSLEPANEESTKTPHSNEKKRKCKPDFRFEPLKRKKRNIEEEDCQPNYLKRLYSAFFRPIRELVEGTQIVIVPHGPLHLVPYAALVDEEDRYVADSLQVRLVPSLMSTKITKDYWKQSQTIRNPLVIGDPDTRKLPRLEFARKEALLIGQILKVSPLIGEKATKQNILQKIADANVIHVAAHGDMERGEIFLARSPESDLTNKDEYMLLMSDVADKHLSANLVVLSCCHSARGVVNSEGVIGIARAFLGAGARSVLVALWAIDDETTMFFMKQFYEHLKCGMKTNESLHLTMKYMREKEEFSQPQQWAPFVLIGDDVAI